MTKSTQSTETLNKQTVTLKDKVMGSGTCIENIICLLGCYELQYWDTG